MRLQNLTKREQWALAGAGVFLVLLTLFWVVGRVTSNYRGMEDKIRDNITELEKVRHLRDQYRSIHSELDSIKSKLDKKEAGFSLLSFIEDLANQQNIRENIASFKPDKKSLNEAYRELSVDLVIDNITLPQLVEFIYRIENSNHLVRVKRLRIKSRFDNPDLLNVMFQVSTYEKI